MKNTLVKKVKDLRSFCRKYCTGKYRCDNCAILTEIYIYEDRFKKNWIAGVNNGVKSIEKYLTE